MKFLKAAKSDAQKPKTKKEFLAQKALKKKKLMRIGGGVFAFIAFLIWFGLQPLRATTEYGICKTYIERMIQFPTSLDVTTFDIFGNAVRIFFTHRDGSGSTRSQQIECRINPDIENIYVIVSIKIDQRDVDSKKIAKFNQTIPSILAGNPNLIIPNPPRDDSLLNLRREQ